MVERELACVVCGYSLRGLESTGVCPECGASISRTLRGDMLRNANRAYLRRLLLGTRLVTLPFAAVLFGMILAMASVILLSFLPSAEPVVMAIWWIVASGIVVGAIAWPVGWFLVTSHEPGVERADAFRCFMVRAASMLSTTTFLLLFLTKNTGFVGDAVSTGVTLFLFISYALFYYPSLLVAFAIIARAPGYQDFGRVGRVVLWFGPVCVAAVAVTEVDVFPPNGVIQIAFLGAIVWAIVYGGLLDRARRGVSAEYAHSNRTGT